MNNCVIKNIFITFLLCQVGVGQAAQPLIVKPGKTCPSKYYRNGNYCVPTKDADMGVRKEGTCPQGYYTNAGYCLKRDKSK
jgi:hypothetical protein